MNSNSLKLNKKKDAYLIEKETGGKLQNEALVSQMMS